MQQEKIIRSLKRQLLVERTLIVLVVLFFIGRYALGNLLSRPYTVEVDGKPIVCVATRQDAEKVIAEVAKGPKAEFKENVSIGRSESNKEPVSPEKAAQILRDRTTLLNEGWVIFVDGKPGVALRSESEASQVLARARERFGSRVENLMEEPSFKESVTVEPALVELNLIHDDVEEAMRDLVSDAPVRRKQPSSNTAAGGKKREHVVQSGQIAVQIAKKYGISIAKLEQLNPGKNIARLQIGDRLIVGESATKPSGQEKQENYEAPSAATLTVVVRDLIIRNEPIPYTTETVSSVQMPSGKRLVLSAGKSGTKRVKRAVTYENGVKTGSEIIEETVISRPQPERVAIGIGRSR